MRQNMTFTAACALVAHAAFSAHTPPVQWERSLGDQHHVGYSVQETADGGSIVAGCTGGRTDVLPFTTDVLLIKTDAKGEQDWLRTFGGEQSDEGRSVQQTGDGGYILVGTTSYGTGNGDVYLIKADAEGNETWSRTFGGAGDDAGTSVRQTRDDGYIIAGVTTSFGEGVKNVYLIKTDRNGREVWSRTFGGARSSVGSSVQQTDDGGYIIAGGTSWYDEWNELDTTNVLLVKTDENGDEEWSRTIGGLGNELAGNSVQQTTDGGYVICGTDWDRCMMPCCGERVCLIKVDLYGNDVWSHSFGDDGMSRGASVRQTRDGGYIIAGSTGYCGPGFDAYLVKTDEAGNEVWSRRFRQECSRGAARSVQQTGDDGYIVAGEACGGIPLIKLGPEGWEAPFTRGDTNADGQIDIGDAIGTLVYLFGSVENGDPDCLKAADTNDSGDIDIADPIFLLSYLFAAGPEPVLPFGECGTDETEDGLSCLKFPPCW